MKYTATVRQMRYREQQVEVEADNPEQAAELAIEAASDDGWGETDTEYECDPEDDVTWDEAPELWVGHVDGQWGIWEGEPGAHGSILVSKCASQEDAERGRKNLIAATK